MSEDPRDWEFGVPPDDWGGGLRSDWPPLTDAIIQCTSCGLRHGKRYMCEPRWVILEHAEDRNG